MMLTSLNFLQPARPPSSSTPPFLRSPSSPLLIPATPSSGSSPRARIHLSADREPRNRLVDASSSTPAPLHVVRSSIGAGGDASTEVSIYARDKQRRSTELRSIGGDADGVSSNRGHRMKVWPEDDFTGTPYIPVYVMLPLGVIDKECQLVNRNYLFSWLSNLKRIKVDGVMIDCWWGLVEARTPGEYNWSGYKELFEMVRNLNLKLQVVMSFHECGGNVGDDVHIPLPSWVLEIGHKNPDIFFTDRNGRRNYECLSWGVDKERVLRGRTAVQVYYDYMRSFREEFDEFFEGGIIAEVEIGLGPRGELRYPSYCAKHGWIYPGIGEFQCYDKYLLRNLRKAAEENGCGSWCTPPDDAGTYNSEPSNTGFFADGGGYDGYYGRFFLSWYSNQLIDHAQSVLSVAKLALEGVSFAIKISGVHWWYKTTSHAAELTAGFYNSSNRDGYLLIAAALQNLGVGLNFTCVELCTQDQQEEALSDPEALVWQVLSDVLDMGIPISAENALPCFGKEGYEKILQIAKQTNPKGRHITSFTYLRLTPLLFLPNNIEEFEKFVKRMHETTGNSRPSN